MEKIVSCIILLIAAVFLIPGCFAEEIASNETTNATEVAVEPVETTQVPEAESVETVNRTESPVEEVSATYFVDMNVTNLTMKIDETVLISLSENPTTGYLWNVTNSTGFAIVSDIYIPDAAAEGMVGVGGVHEWIVKAVETGSQTFTAVMTHVAEEPTGDEETYQLDAVVE